jgi:uncharacterized protein
MPTLALQAAMQEFLAGTHVAVLSVANHDNRPPLAMPVFYHYVPGGELTCFTNTSGRISRKAELIEASHAATFTVQDEQPPYRSVSVECSLAEIARSPSPEAMLAIVRRYMPEEHAQGFVAAELDQPGSQLIIYTFTPRRWHQFGLNQPRGA